MCLNIVSPSQWLLMVKSRFPDSKVHGANMGPIWGRQDPGGSHVGPMNFVIWVGSWKSAGWNMMASWHEHTFWTDVPLCVREIQRAPFDPLSNGQ